jgi:ribosomal protein L25 (general stress protein Ctc)
VIGLGKERRKPSDEVLDAVDSLLDALRETSKHNQAAARHVQMIRRLRSHGRSYAEIFGRSPTSATHRITSRAMEKAIRASERLDRAEVQALRHEGVGADKIASLCGMTRAEVDVLMADGVS